LALHAEWEANPLTLGSKSDFDLLATGATAMESTQKASAEGGAWKICEEQA
jgi:hypothetical protein